MHVVGNKPSPCKGCDKRSVNPETGYTCHSDCAEYLAYRAERETVYEERKNYNETGSYVKERLRRIEKRRNLKKG